MVALQVMSATQSDISVVNIVSNVSIVKSVSSLLGNVTIICN